MIPTITIKSKKKKGKAETETYNLLFKKEKKQNEKHHVESGYILILGKYFGLLPQFLGNFSKAQK